jgi:hypothetical protein
MHKTDEENMRSWSHHFSVDTCDDPVFRAAMKGYDQVSFVFGLEVTWSLIQQRQQEEEEKVAMEELQRISLEELASGLEDKDTDDSQALAENKNNESSVLLESKSSVSEEADEEWTLEKVYDQIEIEGGLVKCSSSSACRLNACSLWISNLGDKCRTCLVCQESQFGGWPDGLQPTGGLLSCIQKHCSALSLKDSIVDSDIGTVKRDEKDIAVTQGDITEKKAGEWTCPTCTLVNLDSKKKCSACFSKKPIL